MAKPTPFRKKRIVESFQNSIRKTGNIKESIKLVTRKLKESADDVEEIVNEITIDLTDKFVVVVDGIATDMCETEEEAQEIADSATNESEGDDVDADVMTFDDALDAGIDLSQVIEITPETDTIVLEIETSDIAEEIGKEIGDIEAEPTQKDVIDAVTDEIQEIVDAVSVDTTDKVEIDKVKHIDTDTSDGVSTFEITLKGAEDDVEKVAEALKSHLVSKKTRKFLKESALVKNSKFLKVNEKYKIESGLGGIMTAKYKGKKNGEHYFENLDKNFDGFNFSFTDKEVSDQVMLNESIKSLKQRSKKQTRIDETNDVLKPIPSWKEFVASRNSVSQTSERRRNLKK